MESVNKMALCHPNKKNFAKGLCRACYAKERREKDPEQFNKQKRECRLRHLEKYREHDRAYKKNFRLTHLEIERKRGRESYQRHKLKRIIYQKTKAYGITPSEYLEMLNERQGKCDICGKVAHLTIDHCHKTNTIRGMLCPTCNMGLGLFKDNPLLLNQAIEYLRGVKK